MKSYRSAIWLVLAGFPLSTAILWSGGRTIPQAQAQTVPIVQSDAAATSQPQAASGNVGSFTASQRPTGEFLRWQSLTQQQRIQQRQSEPEQWTRFLEFLRANGHNRYLILERQNPIPGSPMRARLLLRWQNLLELQANQPELYDVGLQQFQQEDVLIGLAAQLRQARNHNNEDIIATLRPQIRQETAKLLDLNFRQRDLRIQNAQALLDQQKASLQADESNKDRLVDERARRFMQQAEHPFRQMDPDVQPGGQ